MKLWDDKWGYTHCCLWNLGLEISSIKFGVEILRETIFGY